LNFNRQQPANSSYYQAVTAMLTAATQQ